jgi:phenylalanyl-tRNA synthetase beta chain
MKIPFSWLKDHLDTTHTVEEIAIALTEVGLEVDSVLHPGKSLAGFKVAEILDTEPHPDADKLQVCTVDAGYKTPLQIVCGAPNARPGIKVVLGLEGQVIPATGLVLKDRDVRGVKSYGMICSADELGLESASSGVLELSEDAKVGEEFITHMGLDDPVIEIDVTPNRPDCLGIRGVARDLAAKGMGTLKSLNVKETIGTFPSFTPVVLDLGVMETKACPHFMGRVIRNIKNKPSPLWLQKKLRSIGLAPISALVDITNYVCFDLCRPLHVYDAAKIQETLHVRFAQGDEFFLGLNGKEYALNSTMIAVADSKKVLSLAGILGGENSRCTFDTTTVFLESAFFDPSRIAATGRKLGILTDSRYRLERGVDPLSTALGLEKATQLILEICGGEASHVISVGHPEVPERTLKIKSAQIEKLTGLSLCQEEIMTILGKLGFESQGPCHVKVPSWRPDVRGMRDLVEEVTRIYGYDKIPETPLPHNMPALLSPSQQRLIQARHLLASRSFLEVVTYSMIDEKNFKLFGGTNGDLRIHNPITLDMEYLRPSLLITLLDAIKRNRDRGLTPTFFFEVGPQYLGITADAQHTMISGMRSGRHGAHHWSKTERPVDLYDIKNDMRAVLEEFGVAPETVQIVPLDLPAWYHPGRAGRIQLGPKNFLGYFGEIHPGVLKELGIEESVVAFEFYLDKIPFPKSKDKTCLELSPFQAVSRDFAFVLDEGVAASTLISTIKKIDPLVKQVYIFDIYQGPGVPNGKKSLGIRVRLEPQTQTFTEEQIKTLSDRIVETIEKKTGGLLRS